MLFPLTFGFNLCSSSAPTFVIYCRKALKNVICKCLKVKWQSVPLQQILSFTFFLTFVQLSGQILHIYQFFQHDTHYQHKVISHDNTIVTVFFYTLSLDKLDIPKGYWDAVNRGRTHHTMAKRNKDKWTINDLHNIMLKVKYRATRTPPVMLSNLICYRVYIALRCMAFVTVYLHACTIFISFNISIKQLFEMNTFLAHVKPLQQDIDICGQRCNFAMQKVANPVTVILCYIYNQKVFSHFDPSVKLLDISP